MSARRASPPALKLRRRVDLGRNNALLHAADFSFKWIYFRNYCDLSTSLARPNSPQSGSGKGFAKDQTTVIGFSPVQDTKLTGPQ